MRLYFGWVGGVAYCGCSWYMWPDASRGCGIWCRLMCRCGIRFLSCYYMPTFWDFEHLCQHSFEHFSQYIYIVFLSFWLIDWLIFDEKCWLMLIDARQARIRIFCASKKLLQKCSLGSDLPFKCLDELPNWLIWCTWTIETHYVIFHTLWQTRLFCKISPGCVFSNFQIADHCKEAE